MSDKKDSYVSEDHSSWEWHLEFPYVSGMPCPFPIVPAGTRPKHDAVGHLSSDGRVHVFNAGIIEKLVRAGLRARVSGNGTKSGAGMAVKPTKKELERPLVKAWAEVDYSCGPVPPSLT